MVRTLLVNAHWLFACVAVVIGAAVIFLSHDQSPPMTPIPARAVVPTPLHHPTPRHTP
jgi:hypothetical protein